MIDLDRMASRAGTGESRVSDRGPVLRTNAVAIILAALGLALIAVPVVFSMFTRAPAGATMLQDFTPFMTSERLAGFSGDIGTIDDAVAELDKAGGAHLSPAYAQFATKWPAINTHMSTLMNDVTDNLGNYRAVAGLPSFSLFPWFFVIPGAVLVGAAAYTFVRGRWTRGAQVGLAILGIGLVAGPLAMGMYGKAPRGAEMMGAFKTIETQANVSRIQGYFSEMAGGQGAIRIKVVPALKASGLSDNQIAVRYPATTRLDDGWIHILNDMTPMIGAMSDNVDNYDALVALPPFGLLPWFFGVPGATVLGLVIIAGRPRQVSPQGDPR